MEIPPLPWDGNSPIIQSKLNLKCFQVFIILNIYLIIFIGARELNSLKYRKSKNTRDLELKKCGKIFFTFQHNYNMNQSGLTIYIIYVAKCS